MQPQAMLQRWTASSSASTSSRKEIVELIKEDEVGAFEIMLKLMYKPDLPESVAGDGRVLLKTFTLARSGTQMLQNGFHSILLHAKMFEYLGSVK